MAGDCYSANGRWMIGKDNSYRLVHGVAILPKDGKPFGHCWIEKGSLGIEQSSPGIEQSSSEIEQSSSKIQFRSSR